MIENRKFAVAVLVTCTLFVACAGETVTTTVVDVRPIGQGLEFLGIALVLATLVVVLGKFIRK